ncbi:hypothetical protein ACE1CA_29100 [Aerosakkonemataceae cyanobacterium BLCC-F167]|uniref:Uncharacterized protein n=1 Tax=Floridaenema evergladense BLCC-F167 TaxID=3153639 RepID=A0ABV4WTZ2_9CYAN
MEGNQGNLNLRSNDSKHLLYSECAKIWHCETIARMISTRKTGND